MYFEFLSDTLDVNVHPTKMELRFGDGPDIYKELCDCIYAVLTKRDLIPEVPVDEEKKTPPVVHAYTEPIPEPFEKRRLNDIREAVAKDSPYSIQYPTYSPRVAPKENGTVSKANEIVTATQTKLSDIQPDFLSEEAKKKHRIIGQLFETYWLIEYEDKLYIIDQHAAHEKVLFERTMNRLKEKEFTSQSMNPPLVISLDAKEMESLEKFRPQIERIGYVVESFGGREYMISGVPDNLFHMDMKDLFIEMLDDFSNLSGRETPELILEKVASMSCKAAVKGNNRLSYAEAEKLIDELLTLENPYNCPHGRPTIIAMTKYELEKKFKRIV